MKKYTLLTVIFLFIALNINGQLLQTGLVFYAPFDNSTVNLVGWIKPINTGATLVSNKFGEASKAISFDGINDLLDYGDVTIDQENFSVSCWVKIGQSAKGNDVILSKDFVVGTNYVDNNGDTIQLQREQWLHLVIVHSKNIRKMYLDGVLVSTKVAPLDHQTNIKRPLILGGVLEHLDQNFVDQFRGELDELRIYNRSLSDRAIDLLYEVFSKKSTTINEQLITPKPIEKAVDVLVYPNPTSRFLKLRFTTMDDRDIEIVDRYGRSVFFKSSNNRYVNINVAGFVPGAYFIKIKEHNQLIIRRFIKQGIVLP